MPPGERTPAQIEASQLAQDYQLSHLKDFNPKNWPKVQSIIYSPDPNKSRTNEEIINSLRNKVGPSSLTLTPSQVDEISKVLKLDKESTKYLKEIAAQGPIEESLLDVIHLSNPKDLLTSLPPIKNWGRQDAKDFINFIMSDSADLSNISNRSAVGHILHKIPQELPPGYFVEHGVTFDRDGNDIPPGVARELSLSQLSTQHKNIRDKYGISIGDVASNISSNKELNPILKKIFPSFPEVLNREQREKRDIARDNYLKEKEKLSPEDPRLEILQQERKIYHKKLLNDAINSNNNIEDEFYKHAQLKPEKDAIDRLSSQGFNVNDPLFYALHGKELSPRELARIIEQGPTNQGTESDIKYLTAIQQARKNHEKRTGQYVPFPTIVESTYEDPNIYKGKYVADVPVETLKSRDLSKDISDTLLRMHQQEHGTADEPGGRLTQLIEALNNYPELEKKLKPQSETIEGTNQELKNLRQKYFANGDYRQSPIYQEAINRNKNLFEDAVHNIDKRMEDEVIPEIRGRFQKYGIGHQFSPGYRKAARMAEEDRQRQINNLRLRFEQMGHEQGLHSLQSNLPLEENLITQTHNAAKLASEDARKNWEERNNYLRSQEALKQTVDQRGISILDAARANNAATGEDIRKEQTEKIAADMAQYNQLNPQAQAERVYRAEQMAHGHPGVVIPAQQQSPVPVMIPPSPKGAVGTGLMAMFPQLSNAHQGQQQPQQQPQQQQLAQYPNQYQQGGYPPPVGHYAEGGTVLAPPAQYDEMMAQQLAAIQDFIRQKQNVQGSAIPVMDPRLTTMGSTAAKMGQSMGPNSLFGAWAQGMGTYPEHQNAYLEKGYNKDLKSVEMEKMLAELRKEATNLQKEREHNLKTEEHNLKTLAETSRHNKASEVSEDRKINLLGLEKERKSREPTEKDIQAIHKDNIALDSIMKTVVLASSVSGASDLVNTGPIISMLPQPVHGWVGSNTTGEGLDHFAGMTAQLLESSVDSSPGGAARTATFIRMKKDSKAGVDKKEETNKENSSRIVSSSSPLASDIYIDQLRRGRSIEDIRAKWLEDYNGGIEEVLKNVEKSSELNKSPEEKRKKSLADGVSKFNDFFKKMIDSTEKFYSRNQNKLKKGYKDE